MVFLLRRPVLYRSSRVRMLCMQTLRCLRRLYLRGGDFDVVMHCKRVDIFIMTCHVIGERLCWFYIRLYKYRNDQLAIPFIQSVDL